MVCICCLILLIMDIFFHFTMYFSWMRPMIQDLCLLNFLVPKLLSPISSKQKPRWVQLFYITNQLFKPTVLCNNQLLELSSTKPIQSVGLNSRIFFWKVKTSNIEERRVFWGKVSSVEHDHAWQRLNKIISAINPNLETSILNEHL